MGDQLAKPEKWGEAYEAERPLHLAFTDSLEMLLHQLLDEASIPYVQIESRTKEVSNFVAKLRRKNEKYENPLKEVTDLVGLRIILFYLDDVEKVGELIRDQFEVDLEHSIDKSAALDPDRFGYLSVHHIIRLTPTRRDLMEWKRFSGYCAEVQVRTVLQHAWAAINRKLAYATVREAPRELQRNLNRLSALLELADDEFLDIRNAREAIEQHYDTEIERGNLDLALDDSSLEVYFRDSHLDERIEKLARAAGSPTETSKSVALGNFEATVTTRDVLTALDEAGVEQISDLDELLTKAWDRLPDFMREVNSQYVDGDGRPISDDPRNWLVLIILWLIQAPAESFEGLGYVGSLTRAIIATYES